MKLITVWGFTAAGAMLQAVMLVVPGSLEPLSPRLEEILETGSLVCYLFLFGSFSDRLTEKWKRERKSKTVLPDDDQWKLGARDVFDFSKLR